jgi:dUTP pyrophosphatase
MGEEYSEQEMIRLLGEIQHMTSNNTDTSVDLGGYIEDLVKYETPSNYDEVVVTKFVNTSNWPDPEYAKVGDSGFDLRANIEEPITLKPLERALIPSGLRFELPPNTEIQVRPRSGMALKHGIGCLNSPGTVDEGYRGDVGVVAVNLSNEEYTIQPGERIAQAVIMNVIGYGVSKLTKVDELSETQRGDTGYGSSGKN